MNLLKNKVIVITGGSDGLGKQLAIDLAKEKSKVIILARTESKLISVKNEIEKLGGRSDYFICDVGNLDQVENICQQIIKKYKAVDILINNAGIYFEDKTINISNQHILEMFKTNTLGTIYLTKAFLPTMINKNRGQILNIDSVAGITSYSDSSPYSASKWAITGFTESLREELKNTRIKIMSVNPAGMQTNIFKAGGCNYSKNEPWMMKTKDVSKIILFMLSQPDDINLNRVDIKKLNFNIE